MVFELCRHTPRHFLMLNLVVQSKADGKNPFTIMCYCCGWEFGSKSIDIQCLEKWDKKQSELPRGQRKPRPKKPSLEPPLPNKDGSKTSVKPSAEYNEKAFAEYADNSRFECDVCGRKFAQDSLIVHKRSCKPGGFFDRHRVGNGTKTAAKLDPQESMPQPDPKATAPKMSAPDRTANACSNCTKIQPAHAKFCSECGTKQ